MNPQDPTTPQQPPVYPTNPEIPQPPVAPAGTPLPQMPAQPYGQPAYVQPPQPNYVAQPPMASGMANSSSKKMILIVVAVVVGIAVLAGIGLAAKSLSSSVSKADVDTGAADVSTVFDKYTSFNSAMTKISYADSYTTKTELSNDLDAASAALTAYQTAEKSLDGAKILKNAKVKDAYTAYNKKYTDYIAYSSTFLDSYKVVGPVIDTCEDSTRSSSSASYATIIAPCETALATVTTVKDADLNTFVQAFKTYVAAEKSSRTAADAALAKDDFKGYETYSDQSSAATKTFEDASTDADSNIQKHAKAVDPYEELTALQKASDDALYSTK